MRALFLMIAVSCVLAACGGGNDEVKDADKSADAQKLAAAPRVCEAGMTLSGDTCVHQATRPAPGQPLEDK